MTTRPGYRWLLPAGHLLIDCLVLALWVWHAEMVDRERPTFHAAAGCRQGRPREGSVRLGTVRELLFGFGLGTWAAVAAIRAVLPIKPAIEMPPEDAR